VPFVFWTEKIGDGDAWSAIALKFSEEPFSDSSTNEEIEMITAEEFGKTLELLEK
jgi:hypothetical protein